MLVTVSCKRTWKEQLDAEKLKGSWCPIWPTFLGKSKNGQDVVLEDGTEIKAADYISAPRPGKIITILGDTRKTNASVRLAVNADVLVHESTYGKGDEKIARNHGHSTNMQAAQVALEAGAKRLLLNHISARFLSKDISKLKKDAASVFENVHVVKRLRRSGNLKDWERISMPTILITGASGGLAQEMVKLLPNDQLILLGRNKEKLAQLYGNHPHAEWIEIDITDDSALETLLADLYLRYGKIDVLINNAGYGIFEEFDQISDQDIHQMFEVNAFALMNLSRRIAARMKESRKGHIINIVSMAGLIATGKSSLYSATKFAAIGFSNALRLELTPYGVFVTTVNPGPIRTGFFDQADPDGTYLKSVERFLLEPAAVAKNC